MPNNRRVTDAGADKLPIGFKHPTSSSSSMIMRLVCTWWTRSFYSLKVKYCTIYSACPSLSIAGGKEVTNVFQMVFVIVFQSIVGLLFDEGRRCNRCGRI